MLHGIYVDVPKGEKTGKFAAHGGDGSLQHGKKGNVKAPGERGCQMGEPFTRQKEKLTSGEG